MIFRMWASGSIPISLPWPIAWRRPPSHGLDFYVLDRPNPITASAVQGPVLEPGLKSYVGYFALPVRYGMTVGELAQLFNQETESGPVCRSSR